LCVRGFCQVVGREASPAVPGRAPRRQVGARGSPPRGALSACAQRAATGAEATKKNKRIESARCGIPLLHNNLRGCPVRNGGGGLGCEPAPTTRRRGLCLCFNSARARLGKVEQSEGVGEPLPRAPWPPGVSRNTNRPFSAPRSANALRWKIGWGRRTVWCRRVVVSMCAGHTLHSLGWLAAKSWALALRSRMYSKNENSLALAPAV
jgi:hypothetical protein